jgi:hypothetical protein
VTQKIVTVFLSLSPYLRKYKESCHRLEVVVQTCFNLIMMKNFDLNAIGVHEMNAKEMEETTGGNPFVLLAVLAGFLVGITVAYLLDN